MKKRNLGNELTVSAIGLGCMGFSHAYGYLVEKEEAIDTIRYAYSIGYDFFDTAECYVGTFQDGRKSINEEIVGEALAPYKAAKIATKCGIKINEDGSLTPDGRPENIIASAEKSLKRLKRDHIDLYYLHRMDPEVPPEEVALLSRNSRRRERSFHMDCLNALPSISNGQIGWSTLLRFRTGIP